VRAVPGVGLNVPIWLLGSSLYSAQLAALLGLPFAFVAHFAPDHLLAALELYRSTFQPSEALARPYAMTYAVVGRPAAVQHGLAALLAKTDVDELMVTAQIFDHAARLRSFELVAAARAALASG